MSFDEQAKADLDRKMAHTKRAKADLTNGESEKSEGIVDEVKDELRGLAEKAKDTIHRDDGK